MAEAAADVTTRRSLRDCLDRARIMTPRTVAAFVPPVNVVDKLTLNGFIESFNGRLCDGGLNEHLLASLLDAGEIIE